MLIAVWTKFYLFSACTRVSNLNLSLHLPKERLKRRRKKAKQHSHVFPKQAQRDGLDETVNPFFHQFHQSFNLFSNPLLFLILGLLHLFFFLGWWVITRWRWSTMECKNFMCNSMDPMRVSSLSFLFFLSYFPASHQVRCFAFLGLFPFFLKFYLWRLLFDLSSFRFV